MRGAIVACVLWAAPVLAQGASGASRPGESSHARTSVAEPSMPGALAAQRRGAPGDAPLLDGVAGAGDSEEAPALATPGVAGAATAAGSSAEAGSEVNAAPGSAAAPLAAVDAPPPVATGAAVRRVDRDRLLGAVLWGAAGVAVTSAYAVGAGFAGDSKAGGALAIAGGVVSVGLAGAAIGLWVNWRRKEPTSMVDYLLAPIVGGLAGALVGGVLAGIAGSPAGTSRLVTHVVVAGLLFCETAGVVAVRLLD